MASRWLCGLRHTRSAAFFSTRLPDLSTQSNVRRCIIFNPAAKGEKARRFRRNLGAIGTECTVKETSEAGNARELAAESVKEGYEIIIAAGGDGTLNEVLNGIADVPGGLERALLGVLPLGTVNVFARELGIPRQPDLAWQTILAAHETRIDLPSMEYGADTHLQRRYFAQLAGAGLDAQAIELVNWSLKKRIGPFAYVIAGLQALLRPPSRITVSVGPELVEGGLVLIGNGRLYGGQFRVFPHADLRDGLLDVCVFPRVNWLTLARCGPVLLARNVLPKTLTRSYQADNFRLASTSRTPLEADGELVGQLPATFSLQRSALRVIVP
ncbi:MAG: diacylglycerol kinase family lipid kinase [Acidobacteriota bacterium]